MPINNPYEDIGKAARALKDVLDADEKTIQELPPLESLLAKHIRKDLKKNSGVSK